MKVVRHNLPSDIEKLELHVFADEHIGDPNSMINHLKKRIEYVKNTKNAYCVLNGDIIDYASRSSIGDIETREYNIMGQIKKTVELFTPIKDKILCITSGNHENRAYKKEGIDISSLIADKLGLSDVYSMTSVLLYVSFGKARNGKQVYAGYIIHGTGNGRKEGGKINRLVDMASICDADFYVHSHSHLPGVIKESFYRVDYRHKTVRNVEKLFVNTASNLAYGGYGEGAEYKPNSTSYPVIYLSGLKRELNGIV